MCGLASRKGNARHVAPGFGLVLQDFDLDGYVDCYLVQNHLTPQEETGPMRGGLSQLLRRNPDARSPEELLVPIPPRESGLIVSGDAKSLTAMDVNRDNLMDLVVGINDAAPKVFINQAAKSDRALPVRLKGPKGNGMNWINTQTPDLSRSCQRFTLTARETQIHRTMPMRKIAKKTIVPGVISSSPTSSAKIASVAPKRPIAPAMSPAKTVMPTN